jgi:hypothetical protein
MKRLILVAALAGIVGCSETTGPSEPFRPEFQKVAQDGLGSGGGGSNKSKSSCEFPQHMSGDCVNQTLILGGTMALQYGACRLGLTPQCIAATTTAAAQWNTWSQTPDANGHTHTLDPGEYYAPTYPIGGPSW